MFGPAVSAARNTVRVLGLRRAPFTAPVRKDHSNGYLGNVVAIPCRDKVSTVETVGLGAIMVCCWMTVPAWVIYHVRDYNRSR